MIKQRNEQNKKWLKWNKFKLTRKKLSMFRQQSTVADINGTCRKSVFSELPFKVYAIVFIVQQKIQPASKDW